MARPGDGTTNLNNHFKIKHTTKFKKYVPQMLLNIGEKNKDGLVDVKILNFDQEQSRRDLAWMIILHEYPFSIVNHFGFKEHNRNLQPFFKMISRNTIKKDCMQIYEENKMKLYSLLEHLSCRVSLTCDM